MTGQTPSTLSSLEYHVLVALGSGPLYGYAIKQAVESESGGALTPRAGSLYRVLARLMTWDYVAESTAAFDHAERHPGLERRYYTLTDRGRQAILTEAQRLRRASDLATQKLGLANGMDS